MCGICVSWFVNQNKYNAALKNLQARGPDATQSKSFGQIQVGFTRLHIQGVKKDAEQPFKISDGRIILCNGEIFNSELLIENLNLKVPEGSSDCAVIPALLERGMSLTEVLRQLDGDFAIVVIDESKNLVQACRDPYGVRPLYYCDNGVASEIKGLTHSFGPITAIEPGTIITLDCFKGLIRSETWHQTPWLKNPLLNVDPDAGSAMIRYSLEEAVAKRLSTVRDIGACLSGGLDSSLVAAIAAHFLKGKGKRLHTYSIGMKGSPDLLHARMVAKHIKSIHHERIITATECLAVIPEVIKAIESFDITTVRASVGNYLVGLLVATETPTVKVVLNGDGADEILGGYLYMRAAPDDVAFETETTRLLAEIHRYDVARSERSMAAHGLESRSPFLDRQFVSVARSIPTPLLRATEDCIEKMILRHAFVNTGLIPNEVLMRPKEAFSDGISRAENSWFESAKAAGVTAAGAGDWEMLAATFKINTPQTPEALWYRTMFHDYYPQAAAAAVAPAMWMPRFVKATDPSARTLELYVKPS
jgi:asparagine synthase (glutamine-hydrolysing)